MHSQFSPTIPHSSAWTSHTPDGCARLCADEFLRPHGSRNRNQAVTQLERTNSFD